MMSAGALARLAARIVAGAAPILAGLWLHATFGVAMVGGDSMRPALEPGDLIVYERRVSGVTVGDIVVFSRPEWPAGVAHRVVAVRRADRLTTKGDANAVADRDCVERPAVIGRLVRYLPIARTGRAVTSTLARWYTHVPIAQKATTERRSAEKAALSGTGPR